MGSSFRLTWNGHHRQFKRTPRSRDHPLGTPAVPMDAAMVAVPLLAPTATAQVVERAGGGRWEKRRPGIASLMDR